MATRNIMTPIYLTPSQKVRLSKKSKTSGFNVSELIREAIDRFLNEDTLSAEDKLQLKQLTAEANRSVKEMKKELADAHKKMNHIFSLLAREKEYGRSL